MAIIETKNAFTCNFYNNDVYEIYTKSSNINNGALTKVWARSAWYKPYFTESGANVNAVSGNIITSIIWNGDSNSRIKTETFCAFNHNPSNFKAVRLQIGDTYKAAVTTFKISNNDTAYDKLYYTYDLQTILDYDKTLNNYNGELINHPLFNKYKYTEGYNEIQVIDKIDKDSQYLSLNADFDRTTSITNPETQSLFALKVVSGNSNMIISLYSTMQIALLQKILNGFTSDISQIKLEYSCYGNTVTRTSISNIDLSIDYLSKKATSVYIDNTLLKYSNDIGFATLKLNGLTNSNYNNYYKLIKCRVTVSHTVNYMSADNISIKDFYFCTLKCDDSVHLIDLAQYNWLKNNPNTVIVSQKKSITVEGTTGIKQQAVGVPDSSGNFNLVLLYTTNGQINIGPGCTDILINGKYNQITSYDSTTGILKYQLCSTTKMTDVSAIINYTIN